MDIHFTFLTLGLFGLGLVTGLYSAVVGGGAILLIPVFTLMGTPLASAIATMRLGAAVQQLVAVLAFWQKGKIEWKPAIWTSLVCLPGAFFGAWLALHLNPRLLSYAVAVLMTALLIIVLGFDYRRLHRRLKEHACRWPSLLIISALLGIYGGFYGAGFSTLLMMALLLVGGYSIISSSASASVAAFVMSVAASCLFVRAHAIDWQLFMPVTAGGMIGSWLGVESAVKFGSRWIHTLLLIVLTGSVIRLVFYP